MYTGRRLSETVLILNINMFGSVTKQSSC